MFRVLICLFSFLFIPAITLACRCGGYAGNLNLALSGTSHVVLAKVEEFIEHGAKLSVQQDLKGETGQETIMAWGNSGILCRDNIPQEYLGQQVIVLLNKIEKHSNEGGIDRDFELIMGTEAEKDGDFANISCGQTVYAVATDEEGKLFVKGDLRTEDGSDELGFDDLQKWIDNPEEPRKMVANAKSEAIMANPHIRCTTHTAAFVKKDGKKRISVGFRRPKSDTYPPGAIVHNELRYAEEYFEMNLDDRFWYSGRYEGDWTETSDEDQKAIEEWVKIQRPAFQVSTELNRQENNLQHLESRMTFVVGENASPLYKQTISVPLESFKDQILKRPGNFFHTVADNKAFSANTNTRIDLPYILPMVDGYFLEIVISSQICYLNEHRQ